MTRAMLVTALRLTEGLEDDDYSFQWDGSFLIVRRFRTEVDKRRYRERIYITPGGQIAKRHTS